MPARSLTLLTLGALAAALLLAAGCGGDAKKLVGTWQLDLGKLGEMAQDYSVTMTLNRDGTGIKNTSQTFTADMPPTQSQKFDWEIKDKQLVMSAPDASMTQKADYEFQKDGTLSLKVGEQPAMKFTRVK
jgi:hypothetical protein